MLGATMASISDGCVSEQRDPCASPPCKRLKQGLEIALPVECIVIEDSNESTTGPSTNEASHAEAPTLNETTTSENQPIESVSHTEQCMRNSDVTSMETEGLESQFEHKSEVLPQLPVMLETKSDVKSISVNNSNGTMLNGNGASNSSMNAETNGDEKEVPSCIPPKVKDSATLLKFFKPVTPGSKSTIVENMKKTPSKNDGETVLKSNNEDVVISSPCSPVNTSPDTLEMTAIKKTPSPPPASSDDKTTPRRKTPGRKLSVEEKQKREEERLRKQKEKEALEKERLEKKKEKERLREERLKEKMEAKQKKEQERSEQQEMKKQRERERIEKKEQDEKERKEKLEKKEAEKKKKEDEKK
ncbi:putative uncharacterized protein DDB_G0271982 [Dendronephthya gigantea]|uniref:putative uncharacterized protein DDB_G0271982 n=1 Tax=Dendronephthya gigantea TaxID=151771 RepID=UPI00106C8FD1|nr:putative uncharacterized protein DDB_G0271982 [Dendronephthya gigantea]